MSTVEVVGLALLAAFGYWMHFLAHSPYVGVDERRGAGFVAGVTLGVFVAVLLG